ncbi:MAG TPA: hypothetical protein VGM29_12715 [Polyangiaceae bacterium]|jgi:hypothetical protein
MPIPDQFKYDVRVRERLLRSGDLSEADLKKHVDALADVSDQLVEVELKQPALQKESERVERVSRPAPARPIIAPARSLEDELNGVDDDDDDDLKPAAKPGVKSEINGDEEDDDDDDEDDDDDDDDDNTEAAKEPEAKLEPEAPKVEEGVVKKDDTDEGWDK